MTEEKPWWLPLRDALVKKVVEAINDVKWDKATDPVRVDAEFEDVPPKAPRKRRKALPAPPDPNVTGKAPTDEK